MAKPESRKLFEETVQSFGMKPENVTYILFDFIEDNPIVKALFKRYMNKFEQLNKRHQDA